MDTIESILTIFAILMVPLAAEAAGTAWFDSEIFDGWRRYFDTMDGFLPRLLKCPTCFAYHASFWLVLLFILPTCFFDLPWKLIITLPIHVLAATDIVHWLQDLRSTSTSGDNSSSNKEEDKHAS